MSERKILTLKIPKKGEWIDLDETETHHLLKVLRLQNGDFVTALDGKGSQAHCELRVRGGAASICFVEALEASHEKPFSIHLIMAITKGDSMEWLVEKCVELNVQELTPIQSARTVVRMKDDQNKFMLRWQKIADQALKQCGRTTRLQINPPQVLANWAIPESSSHSPVYFLDELCSEPLLVKELDRSAHFKQLTLICGPEGGWEPQERQMLTRVAISVSLGQLTLRAETAALLGVALSIAHFQTRT